jgi:organic radical activating enzyme
MFGKNVITKPYPDDDGSLKVHSFWYTIQGEGPDAGRPAVFVRLSHCNLRCFFCDTQFDTGEVRECVEIAYDVVKLAMVNKCPLVVITGGEPFLQNVGPFIALVNQAGIAVSIETAGTVFLPSIPRLFAKDSVNKIVCSPKTPLLSPNLIPHIHSLKYIIRAGEVDESDGLPCMSTQIPGKITKIYRPCQSLPEGTPIYVQPMDEANETERMKNIMETAAVCMKFGYRLSIQLHKLVGVD